MANIVLPAKDRGTFFFDPFTASQVSKAVTDDRLQCRNAPDQESCIGEEYSNGGANGSWKDLVDCTPLEDLNVSLNITVRNDQVTVQDITDAIEILRAQIEPTLELAS